MPQSHSLLMRAVLDRRRRQLSQTPAFSIAGPAFLVFMRGTEIDIVWSMTVQRARRRRPQSAQSSLHSSCASSLCSFLSGLRRILHSTWYWAFSRFWQYGRIVATRYSSIDGMPWYGSIVATTATQLLINTTWFSFPRDIGTPRRCTAMHRDIGTLGHWNPEGTGREKGHRPENREWAPTRGTAFFRYPLGRRRQFLRCLVHGQVAHGGYDVLGRCMLLAGAVFGLFFPRL